MGGTCRPVIVVLMSEKAHFNFSKLSVTGSLRLEALSFLRKRGQQWCGRGVSNGVEEGSATVWKRGQQRSKRTR